MAQLPDEQRWPIALVLIEGLSYRDAAAVLEIPIGTVTSRLARGREALQALLEENCEGHQRIHSAGLCRRRVDTRPGPTRRSRARGRSAAGGGRAPVAAGQSATT
ncbi:sigma factor-like helix-turn-helix DNA-binding protein [Xanthomonas vasicola]|nr:sigma factor-like helix-turn-helix DNA-binding protein [Xanthomonas vasicola]MDO6970342.1 sigma factor-like helix-turn-helix DNA-binding protein [Xanthomonas vasicola]